MRSTYAAGGRGGVRATRRASDHKTKDRERKIIREAQIGQEGSPRIPRIAAKEAPDNLKTGSHIKSFSYRIVVCWQGEGAGQGKGNEKENTG